MKYLFIDMDGTITSFENDRGTVHTKLGEFTKEFFETREPLIDMFIYLHELFPCDEYEYHILSNSPFKECTEGKQNWLDKNFPISRGNRHFLEYNEGKQVQKWEFILDFCKKNATSPENCILIDDTYKNLYDAELVSIESWHPSKVLCKGRKKKYENL